MNEKVLKDKNFKLELDEDEITIKNFIESDEVILYSFQYSYII